MPFDHLLSAALEHVCSGAVRAQTSRRVLGILGALGLPRLHVILRLLLRTGLAVDAARQADLHLVAQVLHLGEVA